MSRGARFAVIVAILVYLLGQIAPALMTAVTIAELPQVKPAPSVAKALPGPSDDYLLIRDLRQLESDLLKQSLSDRVGASALVGRAADRLEKR